MNNNPQNSPDEKHTSTGLLSKNSFYMVMIVILLVILTISIIMSSLGINIAVTLSILMSCVEWMTKFILPWIFLFYFIKLVHSYTRSKQG
ncbi:hypothetical protein ACFSVM_23315 [Paenibacillus shunpengii]|uniref:Uncharacterized protein n=1 Tax=Paenibacillus shunpengii TaxID=2054424 RepID=A0ABW5SUQ7_9BACL|nr:hypothetical protein [Paenibacillus sp. PDC88]SDW88165.1 hypothetical protein SAMN05518848_103253 [Paenibacillus sp. PDC88]